MTIPTAMFLLSAFFFGDYIVKGFRMPKKPKPQPQPTNGPYTWGNGPKPYGIVKRIVKRIQGK